MNTSPTSSSRYDAIVVGGGPAGSLTAWHLAKAGLKVLVLEARVFPRPKACGGGLQARIMRELPLDIEPVVRGRIRDVTLTFGLRGAHTRSNADTLVYMVLRSEFDDHLLRRAQDAGAVIRERARVRGLSVAIDGRVTVATDDGTLTADCLVGADGANSVVRNELNSRDAYFWQAAVYCEVPERLVAPDVLAQRRICLDWGTLPSGYAWAFPKDGFVNVGAGAPVALAKHLREYASVFVRSLGMLKSSSLDGVTFVGHQLPTLTARSRVADRSVLLVGDAAGLVEPFTGEGLVFACQSAAIAAKSIVRALSSGVRDLSSYSAELLPSVRAEMASSRALLRFSTIFPKRVYQLFRNNDHAWKTLCRVLRGEECFQHLAAEILGPLRVASRAIDTVSRLVEPVVMRTRTRSRSVFETGLG